MRIFLMRHGFSEGNENPDNYQKRGDPDIELNMLGWKQAIAAGQFLEGYLNRSFLEACVAHDTGHASPRPLRVWTSSFTRTRQTTAGVLHGAGDALSKSEVRVSPYLVEQDFGIFSPYHSDEMRAANFPLEAAFYRAAREKNRFYARAPMGESPLDVQQRATNHTATLKRDAAKGNGDSLNVTHGVTLRAFAMGFLHIDPVHYRAFTNPENCSIYLIDGENGNYSFRQIYNGETMQPVDIDWGKKLKMRTTDLPPVPTAFRL